MSCTISGCGTSCGWSVGAGKQTAQAKRAEELDVDDFLNGGFLAVDDDKDQLSDLAESSDEEEAGAAAVESDEEQDAYNATNAAADEASDSDGK